MNNQPLPVAPQIESIPGGLITLDDYEQHARSVLPPQACAYFCGGAADEYTLRHNRTAWQQLQLAPRVLRRLANGHTQTTLLRQMLDVPLLLAAVAYQKMAHADGEYATAHAAAACGVGMVLSTQSSIAVEHIAPVLHEAEQPIWFQLYFQPQRAHTLELIQRAEQAGCQALVLTVDAPVQGVRDAERRSGFTLPANVRAVHLQQAWNKPQPHASTSSLCQGLAAQAATWDDVHWLLAHTQLPVLLKGITHPDDAQRARDIGVSALIVSNHGGRTLDTMPATAHILPRIRHAVGPCYPLLVDGGIRRGTDIFKALALGANAALIGRPQVFGLACAGAAGVAHVLRLLRDELEACMTLCGCATVSDIKPGHIWKDAVKSSLPAARL